MSEPIFFATPADLRAWFHAHHDSADHLLLGYYKKGSGRASVTWPESVDEALCFGWIDGIRRSLGAESYVIRFTPRRPRSNWSAVNLRRVPELIRAGRMQPAGLAAYQARPPEEAGIYSYEQRKAALLDEAEEDQFRTRPNAWEFFQAQPQGYRSIAIHWVVSAKKQETRTRRLAKLIEDSAEGLRIGLLRRKD